MNATLREQLKELRLSGLSQSLEVRLHEAKSSKLDHAEFLEMILADELVVRRDRQIARRTKTAAFRDQKSIDDFDFEFNTSVRRKQIYDLAAGDFVRKHHDAILVGPPGVGKSHIVQSIGRQLIRDGFTVYYRSIFDCVRDFLHDELASLSIGSLELDAPTPFAILAAGDEKNGQGSEIPLRADLVVELRAWIAEKCEGFNGSDKEFSQLPLFSVPTSLLRALNRDLAAASIPKKDDRGRVVDVHAMRMTLATMLNKAGVAPRTPQAIMRHSDIRLTMAPYTDARMLNVSGALDELPKLPPTRAPEKSPEAMQSTGTLGALPPVLPLAGAANVHSESFPDILAGNFGAKSSGGASRENRSKPTKKALSESDSDKASKVGATRYG